MKRDPVAEGRRGLVMRAGQLRQVALGGPAEDSHHAVGLGAVGQLQVIEHHHGVGPCAATVTERFLSRASDQEGRGLGQILSLHAAR